MTCLGECSGIDGELVGSDGREHEHAVRLLAHCRGSPAGSHAASIDERLGMSGVMDEDDSRLSQPHERRQHGSIQSNDGSVVVLVPAPDRRHRVDHHQIHLGADSGELHEVLGVGQVEGRHVVVPQPSEVGTQPTHAVEVGRQRVLCGDEGDGPTLAGELGREPLEEQGLRGLGRPERPDPGPPHHIHVEGVRLWNALR
jgi:hypothetical protein